MGYAGSKCRLLLFGWSIESRIRRSVQEIKAHCNGTPFHPEERVALMNHFEINERRVDDWRYSPCEQGDALN